MLGIRKNRFDANNFFFYDMYSVLLKGCSVTSTNCVQVGCGPFILSLLNTEEYRRGARVVLISVRPVEYAGGFVRK